MAIKWLLFLKTRILQAFEKLLFSFRGGEFLLHRHLFAIVAGLACIPPLLAALYIAFLMHEEEVLSKKMDLFKKKVKAFVEFKNREERFLRDFQASDEDFLQTVIEPLPLLKEDAALLANMDLAYAPLQKRAHFLAEENKIRFLKKGETSSAHYKEVEWQMEQPVSLSSEDVREFLSLVEGVKIGTFLPHLLRPQLIITKFSLRANKEEGRFDLQGEILQRKSYAKS